MDDKKSDDFKYNIVFKSIYYNILKKKDLSENSKRYVGWAKELFQSVTKSLDSIISTDSNEAYHFTPNLTKIIKCSEGKLPKTPKDVKKLKEKFSLVISNLDNLKKDPHKFYETKESDKMLNLINKLSPIYNIKTQPILYDPCGYD